jgi:hypothetical protein
MCETCNGSVINTNRYVIFIKIKNINTNPERERERVCAETSTIMRNSSDWIAIFFVHMSTARFLTIPTRRVIEMFLDAQISCTISVAACGTWCGRKMLITFLMMWEFFCIELVSYYGVKWSIKWWDARHELHCNWSVKFLMHSMCGIVLMTRQDKSITTIITVVDYL